MDFGFLPPEVNSWRIYTGPGSGPLAVAAGGWDSLSAELDIAAQACGSVLSALTSLGWHGPAAQAMSGAVAPYLAWLGTAAEQTKQMALQARAAAAAYEAARAMSVPPAAVTANRVQLAMLVATNFFGQNAPAIAATEAQYYQYWAQDAAAMNGYAAAAGAATRLPVFASPHQVTDASGLAAQHSAVAAAADSAVGSPALSTAPAVAAPTIPALLPAEFTVAGGVLFLLVVVESIQDFDEVPDQLLSATNDLGLLPDLGAAGAEVVPAAPTLVAARVGPAVSGWAGVSAVLGRAGAVGSMSVPAGWGASSGPVAGPGEAGPAGFSAAGEVAAHGSGMPGMPGLPGVTPYRPTRIVPRYGARLTVMARPPAAG
ncbi:PPE family protein [Mycobacterium sp.]|uniref:PPE family protein n=1 Tax=Mycobacterium sp. TaxID=1785 RepID=UPI001278799E|nr:PPE family protein [Mycobacterium sp.]KAA8959847.1 MAG: PPE family protein [Mycobacterium sp.]